MARYSYEPGRKPAGGAVVVPASIDAATQLTVPSSGGGLLECTVVMEGTVTARYRIDGTNPTSANGHLLPAPTATAPVTLLLRGKEMCDGFRIIGTAAGNTITYFFTVIDLVA